MRLATEILPVMSVDTFSFIMIFVLKWAPLGLEVEHVEVKIVLVLVN